MLVYFPQDITEKNQTALSSELSKTLEQAFNHFPGVKEVACGWGVEKDFPARSEDGQPRAVLMGVVGSDNIDSQKFYSEAADYKEAIRMVTGLEGCTSFDSFTISCRHLKRP
jgi:hypothetical protein